MKYAKRKMELEAAVKKYLPKQKFTFPYEEFLDYSEKQWEDKIGLKEALIAFNEQSVDLDLMTEELEKCRKKKRRRNSNKSNLKSSGKAAIKVGILGGAGFAGWWFLVRKTVAEKRLAINQWIPTTTDEADAASLIEVINKMTDAEIKSTYKFVFKYVQKNKDVPPNSKLFLEIDAISRKYGIFT